MRSRSNWWSAGGRAGGHSAQKRARRQRLLRRNRRGRRVNHALAQHRTRRRLSGAARHSHVRALFSQIRHAHIVEQGCSAARGDTMCRFWKNRHSWTRCANRHFRVQPLGIRSFTPERPLHCRCPVIGASRQVYAEIQFDGRRTRIVNAPRGNCVAVIRDDRQ